MFSVTLVVREQVANKPGPFVGFVVLEERVQFFGRWEQANDVEVNAPSKNGIRNRLRRLDMIRAKISLENRIDGIFVRPKLNCWFPWSEISGWLPRERNFRIPFGALIDPAAHERDLLLRQLRTFLRHDVVGIKTRNQFDNEALLAFAGNNSGTGFASLKHGFARIDTEMAFVATASVALDTTGFEHRFDVLVESDRSRGRWGQAFKLFGRELGF